MQMWGLSAIAALVGFAVVYGYAQVDRGGPAPVAAVAQSCVIKGNISVESGERIYHVPGQEHYDETIVSPAKGEHWFCSEAEARAAGWRKAGR